MAKIYKIELYVVDYNNVYNDVNDLANCIDSGWGLDDVLVNCFDKQEVEVEWTDDIDLNYGNVNKETYNKYFKSQTK